MCPALMSTSAIDYSCVGWSRGCSSAVECTCQDHVAVGLNLLSFFLIRGSLNRYSTSDFSQNMLNWATWAKLIVNGIVLANSLGISSVLLIIVCQVEDNKTFQ